MSEYVVKSYMSNNNTECLIERLIIAGNGEKKILLTQNALIQQYFKDKIITRNTAKITDEVIFNTINDVDFNINDKNYLVINNIKELMSLADDRLIFGLNEINNNLNDLREIITSESIKNTLHSVNKKCQITILPDYELEKIGVNIIGIKWY